MAVVVAAGWSIQARGWLPEGSREVLARMVFTIAGPCLLLATVARADLSRLASTGAVVTWSTTLVIVLTLIAVARWGLRLPAGRATVTVLAGSYVNAGNIGIPVAVYLFGDAFAVVPTLLVQVLVMAPIAFVVLDRAGDTGPLGGESARDSIGDDGTSVRRGRRRSPLGTAIRNPLTVATLVGFALAILPWQVPDMALQPFEFVGAAAPPLALLAFGMALSGTGALGGNGVHSATRYGVAGPVLVAALTRAIGHPVLAWAIGSAAGLSGTPLAVVVAMAALPTAQNVVVFATQYRCAVDIAARTCLITTAACGPVLIAAAALT